MHFVEMEPLKGEFNWPESSVSDLGKKKGAAAPIFRR
jgi:hypothetical protein